jgi:hypothetical protein
VVTRDKEYGAELAELPLEKTEEVELMLGNVNDIAEESEVRRPRWDIKDVVPFWDFQVQV